MTIHCIIVEDEPASQDILKAYIADCPNLSLIGTCKNAFEANDVLLNRKVDLMFLDINMPGLSGMKFYKSLSHPPFVIFTTAYPEFALEGFEVDAVDYLLKPFPFERFLKAVNRAADRLKPGTGIQPKDDFMLFKADKKIHKVFFGDIQYLEGLGDYVKVYLKDRFLLVHETLQNLQSRLPEPPFYRIHKSFIVSVDKFSYIEGNQLQIGDQSIPVGNTYRERFREMIGNKEPNRK
jgi:DNA-binding LytR/AlgR family response regulator